MGHRARGLLRDRPYVFRLGGEDCRVDYEPAESTMDRLTTVGLKTVLFYSRTYQRLLRPGLSELHDPRTAPSSILALSFNRFQKTLDAYIAQKRAS